jgi:sugar phosphate isomerase/epimerase
LNDAGAAMKQNGLTFAYHNHNTEFAPVGDTTGWEILLSSTNPADVRIELDVGWVSAAGMDPAAMIRALGPRVVQLHMKDLLPSTQANFNLQMDPTQVGQGRIDWISLLNAARAAGVRHCYVEQEPPFSIDRFDAVAQSAAFLKPLL